MGGRMCVASHVATKAIYTVLLHLIAHFEIFPAEDSLNASAIDPLDGLLVKENPQAQPRASHVRFVPRNVGQTRKMLSLGL